MASRFVRPDTHTLTLTEGDTLVVRARLSNGEQRALFARLYTRSAPTFDAPAGVLQVNTDQVGMALVTAYLLDWSFRDDEGRPVHLADRSIVELEQLLGSLTPEAFDEIHEAIAAHDAAMRELRAAEKKNDDWCAGVMADLNLAIRCGWRYEWVRDLDADVHSLLLEKLARELEAAEAVD